MKYREIVYDIQKDLKMVYDDADIQPYQVLYWVSVVANKFIKQHIDNEGKRGSWAGGKYLSVFPEVPVATVMTNGKNMVKGRKYSELPANILDFDFDKAIGYIAYRLDDAEIPYVLFSRTTAGQIPNLSATFEKPTSDNPYFFIVGTNIYYLGIEKLKIDSVEMGLYTAIDPRAVLDMDEECPLPEHLVEQTKFTIINMGRFVMNIPKDAINDGANIVRTQATGQLTEPQQEQSDGTQ